MEVDKDFALLYGIMLGDGCLSLYRYKKKAIFIAGSLADDIPFFDKVVKPIIKNMIGKNVPTIYRPSCGSINIKFICKPLFDFIHSFGYPVGKKGDKLFIPKAFYEKDLIKYVLQGFFATDGSLVLTDNNGTLYPRVEANGIAKNLILEISNYINSLGIKCNLYERKCEKMYFSGGQSQSRLQINGKENLKRFVELIGFVNPKQIEKLAYYYGGTES